MLDTNLKYSTWVATHVLLTNNIQHLIFKTTYINKKGIDINKKVSNMISLWHYVALPIHFGEA